MIAVNAEDTRGRLMRDHGGAEIILAQTEVLVMWLGGYDTRIRPLLEVGLSWGGLRSITWRFGNSFS